MLPLIVAAAFANPALDTLIGCQNGDEQACIQLWVDSHPSDGMGLLARAAMLAAEPCRDGDAGACRAVAEASNRAFLGQTYEDLVAFFCPSEANMCTVGNRTEDVTPWPTGPTLLGADLRSCDGGDPDACVRAAQRTMDAEWQGEYALGLQREALAMACRSDETACAAEATWLVDNERAVSGGQVRAVVDDQVERCLAGSAPSCELAVHYVRRAIEGMWTDYQDPETAVTATRPLGTELASVLQRLPDDMLYVPVGLSTQGHWGDVTVPWPAIRPRMLAACAAGHGMSCRVGSSQDGVEPESSPWIPTPPPAVVPVVTTQPPVCPSDLTCMTQCLTGDTAACLYFAGEHVSNTRNVHATPLLEQACSEGQRAACYGLATRSLRYRDQTRSLAVLDRTCADGDPLSCGISAALGSSTNTVPMFLASLTDRCAGGDAEACVLNQGTADAALALHVGDMWSERCASGNADTCQSITYALDTGTATVALSAWLERLSGIPQLPFDEAPQARITVSTTGWQFPVSKVVRRVRSGQSFHWTPVDGLVLQVSNVPMLELARTHASASQHRRVIKAACGELPYACEPRDGVGSCDGQDCVGPAWTALWEGKTDEDPHIAGLRTQCSDLRDPAACDLVWWFAHRFTWDTQTLEWRREIGVAQAIACQAGLNESCPSQEDMESLGL